MKFGRFCPFLEFTSMGIAFAGSENDILTDDSPPGSFMSWGRWYQVRFQAEGRNRLIYSTTDLFEG